MTIEALREKFDEQAKRSGKSWDLEDTRNALTNVLKAKKEAKGLDLSMVEPPCELTVLTYNAALRSMPDLAMVKCNPKCAQREAAETSIRSMLSFTLGVLDPWSYVCTKIEDVPIEFRFDAK